MFASFAFLATGAARLAEGRSDVMGIAFLVGAAVMLFVLGVLVLSSSSPDPDSGNDRPTQGDD